MKKSNELKIERNTLVDAQTALTNLAETETRDFTQDEETTFNNRHAQILALDAKIKTAENVEDAARRSAANRKVDAPTIITDAPKTASLFRAISKLAAGKALDGAEREMHEAATADLVGQGFNPEADGLRINLPLADRAQSVSADSGTKGGAFVGSTPQLVMPLMPKLAIEDLKPTILSNLVGNVPLPTSANFTFSYVAETADVTATDVTVSGPTLAPKRCAGVVEISKKLLLQTGFNIEAYIINLINVAYGNAVTVGALNGGGTNEPTGLYTNITTNINTTAGALTHATVVALEKLVDAANGSNVSRAYLSDTKVQADAKLSVLDAGSGRFLYDGQALNGYKWVGSTLMPTLDAGASHPLVFGDWAQLFIGYWGNVSIMVDPYSKASSGMIRLIIEGFSDANVTNEKAFAINKVVTVV